jgi:hypothetical protein
MTRIYHFYLYIVDTHVFVHELAVIKVKNIILGSCEGDTRSFETVHSMTRHTSESQSYDNAVDHDHDDA